MTHRSDHKGILEELQGSEELSRPVPDAAGRGPAPELGGQEQDPNVQLLPGARRRFVWGFGTLLLLCVVPYVVPGLGRFAPWQPGEDYVPFWNLIGRELLGQGEQLERQSDELAQLERLAERARALGSGPSAGSPAPDPETGALKPGPDQPGPDQPGHDQPGSPAHLSSAAASGSALPAPEATAPLSFPSYQAHPEDAEPVEVGIEAPEALAHYYTQLTRTELRLPGAITRAGHWGDSVLGGDGLTWAVRRRLQQRFGDAGHGFHALSRYNLSYVHQGVRFSDRGGWRSCEIIFKCEPDARYGYAGVTSRSSGGGTSRFRTAKEGFGSRVSRFEVWYSVAPKAGRLQVKVNGEVARVIDTRLGEEAEVTVQDAVETFEVPDGEHEFEVRAIGQGDVRGYGVVLERDVPGVVWDELSLIGAFTQRLDYQDPEHLAWQLQRRKVDLMVFMLGGNDVQRETMDLVRTMDPYEQEYTRVIRKFRQGRPEASCLIMSLQDHGERVGRYGVQSRRIVPKLVASQRKVALAEGCAFFDTFEAMGGKDSIGRWYNARPQLAVADFAHLTVLGQELVATMLHKALMRGYADFRRSHEGKPLPASNAAPSNAAATDSANDAD